MAEGALDRAVRLNADYRTALANWKSWVNGGTSSARNRDQDRPNKLVLYALAKQAIDLVAPSQFFPPDLDETWDTARRRQLEKDIERGRSELEPWAVSLIACLESPDFLEAFDGLDPTNPIVVDFLSDVIDGLEQCDVGKEFLDRSLTTAATATFVPAIHLQRLTMALGLNKPPEKTFLDALKLKDGPLAEQEAQRYKARVQFVTKIVPRVLMMVAKDPELVEQLTDILREFMIHEFPDAGADMYGDDFGLMAGKLEGYIADECMVRILGTSDISAELAAKFGLTVDRLIEHREAFVEYSQLLLAVAHAVPLAWDIANRGPKPEDIVAVAKALSGLARTASKVFDRWEMRGGVARATFIVGEMSGVFFTIFGVASATRDETQAIYDATGNFDKSVAAGHALSLGGSLLVSSLAIAGIAGGPLAWAAIGMTLTGMGLVYFTTDDPMVTWLKTMWFGTGHGAGFRSVGTYTSIPYRFATGKDDERIRRHIGKFLGMVYPLKILASITKRTDVRQPRTSTFFEMELGLVPTLPIPRGAHVNIRLVDERGYDAIVPWRFKTYGPTGPTPEERTNADSFHMEGMERFWLSEKDVDLYTLRTPTLTFELSNKGRRGTGRRDPAFFEIEFVLDDAPTTYLAHDAGFSAVPDRASISVYHYLAFEDAQVWE